MPDVEKILRLVDEGALTAAEATDDGDRVLIVNE